MNSASVPGIFSTKFPSCGDGRRNELISMAIILLVSAAIAAPFQKFQYSELHMGTRVNITLYATTQEKAEAGATAAFARFAELDAIMSDYREDSELMKLCASVSAVVSEDLFRVLLRAAELSEQSGGAFDVTCGPLVRLWRESRNSGKLPSELELAHAKSKVGFEFVSLNCEKREVSLSRSGMRLDLGGIAKGYACDMAIEVLKEHGIESAMIEAGGDIAVSKPPPNSEGWMISISGSRVGPLAVSNCGVSTSGDTEQFVEIGGVRYSHILDPRTGLGLTNRLQVTVIAKDAMTSDSLATALCVLGEEKGVKLLKYYGVQAYFVQAQ